MRHKLSLAFYSLVVSAALMLALPSGKAFAEMIGTDAAVARERVIALAQRPELAQQLQAYGIAPDTARERVNAMSDPEVVSLAGRLDALPAGGTLSNEDVLVVFL